MSAGRIIRSGIKDIWRPIAFSSSEPAYRHCSLRLAANMSTAPSSNEAARWDQMLEHLSSMISQKRRADGASWRDAHENMPVYLKRLGIDEEVQKLNVIHVAGTKGKGSTSAMIDSMLRSAGYSTGLFTSPHLCDVRERIRLNGQMVSRPVFVDAFWKCYNTLQAAATPEVGMPGYFRFLTLLGLQIFLKAKPDVVILEVGIGGRIDATNIIKQTAVTAITSLGFDHMELLGNTLDLIAREKAGIMRPGVPCFTVPQPPEAMSALEACAAEVGVGLQVAPSLTLFSHPSAGQSISVGLAGDHQLLNASLAVAMVRSWEQHNLHNTNSNSSNSSLTDDAAASTPQAAAAASRLRQLQSHVLPLEYCEGLRKATWPGRSQIVPHPQFTLPDTQGQHSRLTFYLDGAHTPESMVTCAQWFAQATANTRQQQPASASSGSNSTNTSEQQQQQQDEVRIVIFNCMKERDPSVLLPQLHKELQQQSASPQIALFVPPDSQYAFLPSSSTSALVAAAHQDLSWQQQLRDVWEKCEAARGQDAAAAALAAARVSLPQLPEVPGIGSQELSQGGAAVLSCMADALAWLQAAAAANPNAQLQVLVTGSLYLVGDCLKGLDEQPA